MSEICQHSCKTQLPQTRKHKKLVGQKPPLKPKEVWSIRILLQINNKTRDLALFNLAIDSKLRSYDLVSMRISDVAVAGSIRERAVIVQQKTDRPVQFELTEQTRDALDAWLKQRALNDGSYYSRAASITACTCPPVNMPGSLTTGSPVSALIRISMARTRYDVPKRR